MLGVSRTYSEVGPQPLQVSEIKAWLDLAGITNPTERLRFVRLLKRMDTVELNHRFERMQQERAKNDHGKPQSRT